MDKVPLTIKGFAALEEELRHRQQVERPRIIQAIAEARALGDDGCRGAGTKEDRNHNGTVERERLLRQLQHLPRAVPDEGPPRAGQQLEEGTHSIRLLRELRPAGLLTAGRGAP